MRPGEPSAGAGAAAPSVRQLVMIRSALLLGVLLFGLVTWFMHRRNGAPSGGDSVAALRLIGPVLAVGAVGAAFVFRGILDRTANAMQRANLKLVAWAVSEGAALACTVYYFLAGDARYFAVGVAAMLASFAIVPARDGD